MKEAAFLMRQYSINDPFDLTPKVWNKLIILAAEEAA